MTDEQPTQPDAAPATDDSSTESWLTPAADEQPGTITLGTDDRQVIDKAAVDAARHYYDTTDTGAELAAAIEAGVGVDERDIPDGGAVHGQDGAEPAHDGDPDSWISSCLCGEPFRGATPAEANALRRAHVFERKAAQVNNQLARLTNFIVDNVPDELGRGEQPENAVDVSIRLLEQFIAHPNGRMEPVVRRAIADLDGATDLQECADDDPRELLLAVKVFLKTALMLPPRPGGGAEPVYESDDISLVRFDRDRFRVDHDSACRTIAEMYVAATGRQGLGPIRGVVEDVQDVRSKLDACQQALTIALSHRCGDNAAILEPGTLLYARLHGLVRDTVQAMTQSPVPDGYRTFTS